MSICIYCGVELDNGLTVCPLCGKNPETGAEETADYPGHPSAILRIHKKEHRRYLWELSGILVFSGIAVSLIVDLLIDKGLQWAHLASSQILMVWVILTLLLFCRKQPLLLLSGIMASILIALAAIDLFGGGSSWFLPVGLPITAAAFLTVGILFLLHKVIPLKGLNLIGSGLLIIGGFCIVTEIIIDLYTKGYVNLQWSLITTVSLLPAALSLFFYHYRLKKGHRLDTLFHV